MSYTALINTPIVVDLVQAAKDTGWSLSGGVASHIACNTGDIRLTGYTITTGVTYTVSYEVISINSGSVQLYAGSTAGIARTTTGVFVENIIAAGTSPVIFFRSNANCSIQAFNIQTPTIVPTPKSQNTIAYSWEKRKWHTFLTYTPDIGFSLFTNSYTLYNGNLYKHNAFNTSRNSFYGTEYQSIVQLAFTKRPDLIKSYNSVVLQSNKLLVTTDDGITTSLGQLSNLIDQDFLKAVLDDGTTTVDVYAVEGVFSASMLRDSSSPGGIINGDVLKGNYILIELTTESTTPPLTLFTVEINGSISKIGVR